MPSATVILRTKNSAKTLPQTLKALFSQTFQDFDLFVVDSSSTDQTLSLLQPYPHQLLKIQAHEYFPGKILNLAIKKVETPFLVFLNSDAILLSPYSLKNLLEPFDNPAVVAAFGRQVPSPNADAWVKRDYEVSFPPRETAPPWMHLSLCFAAMRRAAWETHPFYTLAWGSEDNEWGHRAKQEGKKISYVPEAVVLHSHNYTFKQLYGRRFIEGEADAFIYRGAYTRAHAFLDILKAIFRDMIYDLKNHSWGDLPLIPFRRSVYYWAYYKGHRWGEKRLFTHNADASVGQKTVLKSYDR